MCWVPINSFAVIGADHEPLNGYSRQDISNFLHALCSVESQTSLVYLLLSVMMPLILARECDTIVEMYNDHTDSYLVKRVIITHRNDELH